MYVLEYRLLFHEFSAEEQEKQQREIASRELQQLQWVAMLVNL